MGRMLQKLPKEFQFDPEAFWNSTCSKLKESIEKLDVSQIFIDLSNLQQMTKCHILKLQPHHFDQIIDPLFNLITMHPFFNLDLQRNAADLFNYLSSKKSTIPEHHLPLEKASEFYDFFQKCKAGGKHSSSPIQFSFFTFFTNVSLYFNEDDAKSLVDLYRDKIGFYEPKNLNSLAKFILFFPPKFTNMVIEDFMKILNIANSPTLNNVLIHFFMNARRKVDIDYNWAPHIRYIFSAVLTNFNVKMNVLGMHLTTFKDFTQFSPQLVHLCGVENTILSSAMFLSTIIYDGEVGEETLKVLDEFINIFIPTLTPKSSASSPIVQFVSSLILYFSQGLRCAHLFKHNISSHIKSEFIRILLPFVQTALLNANHACFKIMRKSIPGLLQISYDQTVDFLLPFYQNNMYDSEMTATSQRCFLLIMDMIPALFSQQHINDNLARIPTFVEAVVEYLRNPSKTNFFKAFCFLSIIGQYIFIPLDDSKLSIRQRLAATALKNTLPILIDEYFSHHQHDDSTNLIMKNDLSEQEDKADKALSASTEVGLKQFIGYFAMFDASIIEKEVFPRLLDKISEVSISSKSVHKIVKLISQSNPSLAVKVLTPKLETYFEKSSESNKIYWAYALSGTFIPCQEFSEYLPHITDIIIKLLAVTGDSETDTTNLSSALALSKSFKNINAHTNQCWNASTDGSSWGLIYTKEEAQPKWYQIEATKIQEYLQKIINPCILLLEKFADLSIKLQQVALQVISFLCNFIKSMSKPYVFHEEEIPQVKEAFSSIIKAALSVLSKTTNSQAQTFLVSFFRTFYTPLLHNPIKIKPSTMYSKFPGKRKYNLQNKQSYIQNIANFESHMIKIKKIRDFKFNDLDEEVYKALFELYINNESSEISLSVKIMFNSNLFHSINFQNYFFQRTIEILENPNKTETQCVSSFNYLRSYFFERNYTNSFLNTNSLVAIFNALLTITFEKTKKIGESLSKLIDSIDKAKPYIRVKDNEEWSNFVTKVLSLPRSIDEKLFIRIISYICYQNGDNLKDIIEYLLNIVSDSNNPSNRSAMLVLCTMIANMKLASTKQCFSSIDEFKCKFPNLVPYNDNTATGFYCPPKVYTFYTSNEYFELEKYKQYLSIFSSIFNENYLSKLFDSIVNMHSDDPQKGCVFNSTMFTFWKRIAQVVGPNIISSLKNVFEAKFKKEKACLETFCEAASGIFKGAKHWEMKAQANLIDEFLKPNISKLLALQLTDTSIIVKSMIKHICRWSDYRRYAWLTEILEKLILESSDLVLRNSLNYISTIFSLADLSFDDEYEKFIQDIIIPKFSDLTKFTQEDLEALGLIFSSRNCLHNLFSSKPSESIKYPQIFFSKIFTPNKDAHPELVSIILQSLLSQDDIDIYLSSTTQYMTDICLINSKLFEISSGKYAQNGLEILFAIFGTPYHANVYNLLDQILNVKNKVPWNSRLHLIGSIHLLVFSHTILFDRTFFDKIMKHYLPPFLGDDQPEVRTEAFMLLRSLISYVYGGRMDECAEYVMSTKNAFWYCALLYNTVVFMNCPEWLPGIFEFLEFEYEKNIQSKELIKKSINDFWARNTKREFPELESYRYILSESYYS